MIIITATMMVGMEHQGDSVGGNHQELDSAVISVGMEEDTAGAMAAIMTIM